MSPKSEETATATQSPEDIAQDEARAKRDGIEALNKKIASKTKLVAKRQEMLEAAIAQFEKAEYKVTRRTEILDEHQAELNELQVELENLQA